MAQEAGQEELWCKGAKSVPLGIQGQEEGTEKKRLSVEVYIEGTTEKKGALNAECRKSWLKVK